jgi:hypothetical protein
VLLTDANIPSLWSWDRHDFVLKKQQVKIVGKIEDLADLDVVFASKRKWSTLQPAIQNDLTHGVER